jgi:competence protein ComEA
MDGAMVHPEPDRPSPASRVAFVLRRADQPAVVLVLCVAWILVGWFVIRLDRTKEGVVDIDQLEPERAELRVELNSAAWTEFATLPGVGETLGRSIVDYRLRHGAFGAVDEIQRVPGIGEVRFAQIRPYLTIAGGTDQ